jgi:hypothetical protein
MNKQFCAAMAAFALLTTQAMGAGLLAPGKPAGVAKAQDADDNTVLYVLGVGAIVAGVALLASDHHHGGMGSSGGTTGGGSGGTTTTTTTTT